MPNIVDTLLGPVIRMQRASIGKALSAYGLRVDDLLDPTFDKYTKEAIKLLPEREYVLRQRRIMRALDLSVKHEKLPVELQKIQDPFKPYLSPIIEKLKAQEYERINYH
jgi:ubiquinol-cytochrome c reductase subunit 7